MSVKGGCTDTSTASKSSDDNRNASFCTVWIASKWLWCIFQLPLISGLRAFASAMKRSTYAVVGRQFEGCGGLGVFVGCPSTLVSRPVHCALAPHAAFGLPP